jgi:predicted  nucleic acid-binding Zn-ribbon protein
MSMTLAKKLFELQQIDSEISDQQGELNTISYQLGDNELLIASQADIDNSRKQLSELEHQQRTAEWEIDDLQNKIADLEKKLYSGTMKNPKDLLGLEHEVKGFKEDVRQKEDGLLNVMAEIEALQHKISADTERLVSLEKEWKEDQAVLLQKKQEVEQQLSQLDKQRESLCSTITSEGIDVYNNVKAKKGNAVVRVEQGICQGCRLSLAMNELRVARSGGLIQCSSCGKILFLG